VQKVTVPAYLDNNNILLHRGQQEALADSTARWLEPLSQGLTHALAGGLATRLPEDSIVTEGSAESSDRLLSVDVDAFDVWRDGRCILTASWTVTERGSGALLISGYGTFVTAPSRVSTFLSDAALVGAVSGTVDQLTEKIAIGTVMDEITAGARRKSVQVENLSAADR
jgi:uncharacterized lipoprotein YmbA